MKPAIFIAKIKKNRAKFRLYGLAFLSGIVLLISFVLVFLWQRDNRQLSNQVAVLRDISESRQDQLASVSAALKVLEEEDQKVRNDELQSRQEQLEKVYSQSVAAYEDILDLETGGVDTGEMEKQLATVLSQLSNSELEAGEKSLTELNTLIVAARTKLAQESALPVPETAVTNSDPPAAGYSRQRVETEIGSYVVSMVAGDLSSTRVIVDTASGGDCGNDCPVLPLSDYVSRNGGYAGINGTYFCPASYPSCVGKTNTFDLLVMNKDKVYFNSDNNVYSNNPAVIFGGSYVRFVSAASQWGRDTGIDSMLSNYPLLLSGGEIHFAGDGDPKKGSKGNRSFVANRDNTVYIGVVHSATVAEAAWALKALGMENGLNLDNGGSTALWASGYKVGPGRNIPNAIVFVGR